MNWPEVKLENLLTSIQPGFASGENLESGVLQVRMNNVKPDGRWDWSKERRVPATDKQLEKYSLSDRDILFNTTNSSEQVGKSALFKDVGEIVTFSNHFLRLKVNRDKIQEEYLIRYFAYLWKKRVFKNMVDAWVNQATVKRESFLNVKIPLPPLPEQKRIAAILDKADAICRKRQQAIQLADQFLRAVFLDMFGDPVTNPKGWQVEELNKIAVVTTGSTPSRNRQEYYGSHIEWIKSDNINTPSYFLTKASEYLSAEGKKVGRVVPAGSTLVTCIAGSPNCVGNAAFSDREVSFNQQINALTPNKKTNSLYLYALILFSKKLIQSASTNSMKGMVSKGNMEKLLFISPPKELQDSFSVLFNKHLENGQRLRQQVINSNEVFGALSQKAFAGQL